MVVEMLNIIGFHQSKSDCLKHNQIIRKTLGLDKLNIDEVGFDEKFYTKIKSDEDIKKEIHCKKYDWRSSEFPEIFTQNLSPFDCRTISISEDELTQVKLWTRVFPTCKSLGYLDFIPSSYATTLLSAWEAKYGESVETREEGRQHLRVLFEEKHHLKVAKEKYASYIFYCILSSLLLG